MTWHPNHPPGSVRKRLAAAVRRLIMKPRHHAAFCPAGPASPVAVAAPRAEPCRNTGIWFSSADREPRSGDGAGPAPFHHISVLADEVLAVLKPGPGKLILDGTLGGGGHSELLLRAGASVVGIDRDPAALEHARQRLAPWKDRFAALRGNFAQWPEVLEAAGLSRCLDGILLDIGVSSPQFDHPERGFSILHSGPLDMRMDPDAPLSAEELVNTWSEEEIARVIYEFGEERASRRIAAAIVRRRAVRPILTTHDLAEVVEAVLPRSGRIHPATKTFQAIRIAVNAELENLQTALEEAHLWLRPGGVLAVITFHSLEDRMVKQFLRTHSEPMLDRPEWPAPRPNPACWYRLTERRGFEPGAEELSRNPRSRSARLRAAERLSDPS